MTARRRTANKAAEIDVPGTDVPGPDVSGPDVPGGGAADVAAPAAGVDPRIRAPLYHQIYLILRQRIEDGTHPAGSLLPSENELADAYGVSRITSRRALEELVADGLAKRERGRGTRVLAKVDPPQLAESSVDGLVENVTLWGERTTVDILEYGLVPAPVAVAKELGVEPGTPVHRCIRIRRLNGRPVGHVTSHVPSDIGALFSRTELSETPLLALLQRKGIEAARADQTLTATLADPRVARLLGVEVGAPLLRKLRVVHDADDRAVEHIDVLYRPDMYRFRLSMTRDDTTAGDWTPTG